MKNKLTVIIPTKNEEKSIAEIVKGAKRYSNNVIVVDANSKDRTQSIANDLGARVITDNGKGKGAALRYAAGFASHGIILFIDADLSHDTKEIPKLVQPILEGKADIVVGSRMLGGSDELHGTFSNFMRNMGSGLIQMGINYRFNVRLTDCENGFRAIKTNVFQDLDLKSNDFDIEEEMIMRALKRGYKIIEVPSHEYERRYGKSNLSLPRMGWKFVWRLIINM